VFVLMLAAFCAAFVLFLPATVWGQTKVNVGGEGAETGK
jgi:hypothetical protein